MIICHISDIHVFLYKRHQEYLEVFENLYNSLKKDNVELIVICGDLFHSKTVLSPESIRITRDFLIRLSNISDVIIIPGNHDLSVSNSERLNSISPIVESIIPKHKIFFFTESTLFQYKDFVFGIFNMLQKEKYPIEISEPSIKSKIKIALYHGMIKNSTNDLGFKFDNGDSIDIFKHYDIAMLGDIHKYQELSKNIIYSGSLLQHDVSESNTKGYVLWNVDSKNISHTFIEVKNRYGYFTVKCQDKIFPDSICEIENITPNATVRILLQNYEYTISEIKLLELAYRKKYNFNHIEIRNDYENNINVLQQGQTERVSDILVQSSLIRTFLKNNYSSETIERIISINTNIRAQVSNEDIFSGLRWNIDTIEFNNVFSFGENNTLNFKNLHGLIGIFGPNRIGKSSIIETLLYVLFNKSSKTGKIKDIIHNQSMFCNGEAVLDISGIKYRIRRESKRKDDGSSTDVIFEKFVNGIWLSENDGSRTDTDKYIRKKIGTFDDAIISSFAPAEYMTKFISNTVGDTFRLDTISRFLGLNIFKEQYRIADTKIKDIEILLNEFKKIDYAKLITDNNIKIKTVKTELDIFRQQKIKLQDEYERINDLIISLSKTIYHIPDDFSNLFINPEILNIELVKLTESFESENRNIIESKLKLEDTITDISKFNEQDLLEKNVESEKLEISIRNIVKSIQVLERSINKDSFQLEILESQPWCNIEELCKNCKFYTTAIDIQTQILHDKSVLQTLVSEKNDSEAKLKSLTEIKSHLEALSKLKLKSSDLKTKIEITTHIIEKFQLQIDAKNGLLNQYNQKILEIEDFKDKNKKNLEIESKIDKNKKQQTIIKNNLNELDVKILSSIKEISEFEEKNLIHYSILEKIQELECSFNDYKIYLQCVHREGIPYNIISSSIDKINKEVDKILSVFAPFKVIFGLDIEKKNIPIDILYANGSRCPIELESGMEKVISSIAIRAALVNIANIPMCNLFVIDEDFGKLDSTYISTLDSMFDYLKTIFERIIIISHVDKVHDIVDESITIDRVDDFSKIVSI